MQTVWKVIPGFNGAYEASSTGVIRSVDRTIVDLNGKRTRRIKGKVISQRSNGRGYPVVSLHDRERDATVSGYVHRFVAIAFLGLRPNGKEVAHYDGDGFNNNISNLRYATPKDNAMDSIRHGTISRLGGGKLERHFRTRFTNEDVMKIYKDRRSTAKRLASLYGCAESTIHAIRTGQNWGELTRNAKIEHVEP